jgi:LysM repeat protein
MMLDGELMVFIIYQGEGENAPVQWMEESIPFSGEIEVPDVTEDMVPVVTVRLIHRDIEAKPDSDGEMREIDVDAVLELDMKLYKEESMELLNDLYSTNRDLALQTGEACFDKILTKNMSKCKIVEKITLDQADRILQICHSEGTVKIDDREVKEDGLHVEGVLEVKILYMTSDDTQPIQCAVEDIPFHFLIEAPGINDLTICQLNPGLEQLSAVMIGGGNVEVKATISLDLLALQPVCEQIITGVTDSPMDFNNLQKLPGIVGYIVQPGDTLWKIAKKFHTTVDTIMTTNGLTESTIKPGDRLILVKEVS